FAASLSTRGKSGVALAAVPPDAVPPEFAADILVYDASGAADPAALEEAYEFFHGFIRHLDACGRIVVIGRPPQLLGETPAAAAAQALDGFMRSLAKEVGRNGSTANLVTVEPGAEARLGAVVRFVASERSAFVTGQAFPVTVTATAGAGKDLHDVKPLAGKVAVVTGAARGIGAETARRLAEEGATVVVVDRPDDLAEADKTAKAIGGVAFALDVTAPDAPNKLDAYLRETHGGVDIIVHNAGVTRDKTIANMKPEAWRLTVDVSVGAPLRIMETLMKGTLRKGGRVVCLSSIAGIAGNRGQTNYAAAKAGVIGMVRHLSARLAPEGTTVNAVAPGFIETRMTAAMPAANREVARRIAALSQGGQPQDVAEVITFLASPGAVGVTGAVIRVCGGNLVGA
ncbi:3-oxoacyl-ACP reductase, partial [bacterium]|nr:3-oxoacyl-ACP reductase [bacterium]